MLVKIKQALLADNDLCNMVCGLGKLAMANYMDDLINNVCRIETLYHDYYCTYKITKDTLDEIDRLMDGYTPDTALCVGNGQLHQMSMAEQMNTLDCMHDQQAVLTSGKPPRKYIVRRLTPLECCRLQGFPDWWEDGVEGSDSARYKMWGNGIALPCAVDVLRRIAEELYGKENHHRFEDEIIQEAET